MTFPTVLSDVLLPGLAGLAVGFVAGLVTGIFAALRWMDRRRMQGKQMPIYTDETNPTPGHTPWRGTEHFSRIGWILVFAGILGLLAGSVSLYQSNSTASCLRGYIEQSSTTNKERGAAGELDRKAIRQQRAVTQEFNDVMINAVTNPPTDQEKARADFLTKAQSWNARLDEVDRLDAEAEKQRQENPLPDQPNC